MKREKQGGRSHFSSKATISHYLAAAKTEPRSREFPGLVEFQMGLLVQSFLVIVTTDIVTVFLTTIEVQIGSFVL